MKKFLLVLIIVLPVERLFAQGAQTTPVPVNSGNFKQDTVTVYPVAKYERARLDGLLLQMKDFQINSDGSIVHDGQLVKTVKVNGQKFSRLDTRRALTIFPSNMIHNIEMLDVHDQTTGGTERQLNIVTKTNRKDQFADIMVGEGIVRSIYELPMSQMRMDDIADAQYAYYPPIILGPQVNAFGDVVIPLWARQAQGFNDNNRVKRTRHKDNKSTTDVAPGQ